MSQDKSGSTTENLDLSQVGNDDLDALAQKIENYYKQDNTVKSRLSYNWDRNHKFLDGNQWIVFDGDRDSGGMWKRLTVNKANEYIPRPVTNYIFDGYQTLKSYLIKNKPRSSVRPNTQTFKDKAASKVANLCLEANWERLHEQDNYEYAAACLITYGTVFKKDFWDTSASSGIVKVPKMQQVPKTDPTTGQLLGMEEIPAVDPESGQPQFEELPLGDLNSEVVEPQRICIDPSATTIHKAKWIMEYSIQSLDWIREVYGKEGPGYTGRIEELKEESQLSGSMRRFQQLKNSSGVKGNSTLGELGATGTGDSKISNSAVVKEYYERPSAKFPRGRMIVVANSIPLYAFDSPCSGPDEGDWHPYSECRWEIVPGRFWGKSPLDVGVEIQKNINSIDSVIILSRKTMAVPQKLIPIGSGVEPGQWSGRPGLELRYRESGGAIPSVLPGIGVDATVFQERAQRLEDFKNCIGAIDILKGDRPPGVTAASALNLLYEVGTGKLFPVLDRWKKFVECSQRKQLKVIAKGYQEPRENFINMLIARNSELDIQSLNKFIGADLYDNCNVIVEAGSNVPKLQAAKQAALQEAAQVGTLALEQPANRAEYNRQMGITGFDNDVGPDIKRAEWENDLLDNIELSPDNRPLVLDVDNDDIHIEVLSIAMKTPAFMAKPQAVQQAYMQHYQEHLEAQNKKKMMQMQEALASGQPPVPAPAGNAPQTIRGHGKGPTAEMQNILKIDTQVPGQGKE